MTAEILPEKIGPYQIVELIGRGGMGAVYKAYKPPLKRYVAVKTIKAEYMNTPSALERFRREADLASRLKHPNIVTVFDYEEIAGGDSYIVTELIEGGKTLRDRLAMGSLTYPEISDILTQIGSALDYAYDTEHIVHRDIKPANIFFEGNRRVAIGDFGIAKDVTGQTHLTSLGEGIGTPDYMSPEQAMGEPLDRRSDIYSLGVVLFEMLTGTLPFRGDTPITVVMGHIQKEIPSLAQFNPNIPLALEAVVRRAMSKRRDDRYDTAQQMAEAFKTVIARSSNISGSANQATPPLSSPSMPTIATGNFGGGQASSNTLNSEISLVDNLNNQGRHSEAFDRLTSLRQLYPQSPEVEQRYQVYISQGYRPRQPSGPVSLPPVSGPVSSPVSSGSRKKGLSPIVLGTILGAVLLIGILVLVIFLLTGSPKPNPAANDGPTTAESVALNKDGDALYDKADFKGAADKYSQASKLVPTNAAYHNSLARANIQLGDLTQGFAEAQEAIRLNPNNGSYFATLGAAQFRQNKPDEAIQSFQTAVKLNPGDSLSQRNLAFALIQLSRFVEAEAPARKGVDGLKDQPLSHKILGDALRGQNKFAEAEKEYREAAKLDPNSVGYQIDIALALNGQKKYTDAELEVRKAIRLDPNSADAYSALGAIFGAAAKQTEAEEAFRKAISLNPRNSQYQRDYALQLISVKRFTEAESLANSAIKLDNSNPRSYYVLGLAQSGLKKYREALDAYKNAVVNSNSKDPLLLAGLGKGYEDLQQFKDARTNYESALKLDPNLAEAKDGLTRIQGK